MESDHYDPNSNEFEEIEYLVAVNQIEEARNKPGQAMPNLILSPRAHLFGSLVAQDSNNENSVKLLPQSLLHAVAALCRLAMDHNTLLTS